MLDCIAVVVTYNSARYIEDTLQPLLHSPLIEEVVVVDNDSSDDSVERAKRCGATVIESGSNLGFGAAANLGCAHRDAARYLLVNPDCVVAVDTQALLFDTMKKHDRRAALVPSMRYPSGGHGIVGGPEPTMFKEWVAALGLDRLLPASLRRLLMASSNKTMAQFLPFAPPATNDPGACRDLDWLSGFCLLLRGDAFRAIEGFDPRFFLYFEDVDLCTRLRADGWTVSHVAGCDAYHIESASSTSRQKRRHYRQGLKTYMDVHGLRRQRLAARLLLGWPW
jgi:N-acetylglucosaminyl-diphospho-decaprenol L-rhamnosyltransferase